MSNLILFFDTETTGLPTKHPYKHPSQPKILQVGAALATPDGEILETINTLVKIGSTPINKYALAAHGISAERANDEGIEPEEVFAHFHELAMSAEALACHNFNFDIKLFQITAAQIQEKLPDSDLMMGEINDLPYYCTMQSTINYCKLPFPSGRKGFKFPKLEELHRILFQEDFSDAHDAMADITATMRCFFELKNRGIM